MKRLAVYGVIGLVLAGGVAIAGPKTTSRASCTVDDATPAVGQEVHFGATGLQGGGTTRLEIISATDGSYYFDLGSIGSASSYTEEWTFDRPGTFGAVYSRTNNGNVKCDVYVTVS